MFFSPDVNTSSNSFACSKCGIKFSIKATYEQHQKSEACCPESTVPDRNSDESDSSPPTTALAAITFQCNLCTATFAYQSLLNHHRTTEHEIRRYPCQIDFCDQIFSTADELQRHHESTQHQVQPAEQQQQKEQQPPHSNDAGVNCLHPRCSDQASQNLLRRHRCLHRLQQYKCKACEKTYYSETVYATHVRLCQPIVDDVVLVADEDIDSGPVACRMCEQLFENRKVLKFHRQFCADDEAEADERKKAAELRASCGIAGEIEEVYVKSEMEDGVDMVPE